jgi:hypothetical protein
MIAGIGAAAPASMNSTRPNGSFSTSLKVRSSLADSDARRLLSVAPTVVPSSQRRTEAMTSRVVTGEPSWNLRPARSVKV